MIPATELVTAFPGCDPAWIAAGMATGLGFPVLEMTLEGEE